MMTSAVSVPKRFGRARAARLVVAMALAGGGWPDLNRYGMPSSVEGQQLFFKVGGTEATKTHVVWRE